MCSLNDRMEPTLLHDLLQCRTVQALIDAARPHLGHPIMVCDLTHSLLAATREPPGLDARWDAVCKLGGIPLEEAGNDDRNQTYRRSLAAGRPVWAASPRDGSIFLCMALSGSGRLIGYLESPYRQEIPSQETLDLFDLLGRLCSMQLQGSAHALSRENTPEQFLSDLIYGRVKEKSVIIERLAFFHLNITLPVRILSIQFPPSHAPAPDSIQETMRLDKLSKKLTALLPTSTVFLCGRELKLIAPAAARFEDEEQLADALTGFLTEEDLVCGISSTLEELIKFPEYHAQAQTAIRLGTLLEPENRFFYYDILSIYHTLEVGAEKLNLFSLCHPATLILANYDREHNTSLLHTLNVYLCCRCNILESANCMFIHRNTMNYRMAKINELVHLDYDNTDVFFHLMYSFHVLRYYSATVMLDLQQQRQRFPNIQNKKPL